MGRENLGLKKVPKFSPPNYLFLERLPLNLAVPGPVYGVARGLEDNPPRLVWLTQYFRSAQVFPTPSFSRPTEPQTKFPPACTKGTGGTGGCGGTRGVVDTMG